MEEIEKMSSHTTSIIHIYIGETMFLLLHRTISITTTISLIHSWIYIWIEFLFICVKSFFPVVIVCLKRLFCWNFPNWAWYDNRTLNTFGLYICRTLKVSQAKILNCQHDDGERIRFWFSLWRTLVTANGTVSVV